VRRSKLAWVVAGLGALVSSCDKGHPPLPVPRLCVQGKPILSAADSPHSVLDTALKAHGGTDRLARWSCGHVKFRLRSDTVPPYSDAPVVIEDFFQLPGRFKRVTVVGEGKEQKTTTRLITDEQGWEYLEDGSCRLVPGVALESALFPEHAFFYFCNLARLRDPGVSLEVVLHAEADGANPMDYYFDTVTALLVRLVRHVPQPKGDECQVEIELGDYRNVGGSPLAMRIVGRSAGRTLLDFTLLEVEFSDHLDESVFAPP